MDELKKIENYVFDRRTLTALAKVMEKGFVRYVEYPISMGKEALVFKARDIYESPVAIKIYRAETASFSRRKDYLRGDPRFPRIPRQPYQLAVLFAQKEFANLKEAERIGVRAPHPLFRYGPIVVMSFIGENEPYPLLAKIKDVREVWLWDILKQVKLLYQGGLVHADLSAFNILVGSHPFIIDFSQGVTTHHPHWKRFLKRDISNVVTFFRKHGCI